MSSTDQPKAVIYTRVSTNTQEDNYSFPFQLEVCRNYAQQHGMMVVAEFQETASGATLNRPDLEQARAIIRAGDATVLIAYNTDRLSRNLGQLIYLKTEIKHNGGSLHYATRGESSNDAGGDLFENIEDAFAEYERQKIRDRLYTGRMRKITGTDAKPAQVYGNGNCPYGYRYEGFKKTRRIVIDEIEAAVVQEMYRLCLEGMSVQAIANRLNELEAPTPGQRGRNGGKMKRDKPLWVAGTVYRILTRETYIGIMNYNKSNWNGQRSIDTPREEWIPVEIPAIIGKDVQETVISLLAQSRKHSKHKNKRHYLLGSCRLKCQCGYTMTGGTSNGDPYGRYLCPSSFRIPNTPCSLKGLNCTRTDALVWDWLCSVFTPEHIKSGIETNNQMNAREKTIIDEAIVQLDNRRNSLEIGAERMMAAYKAQVITLDELTKDKVISNAELKSLDTEYARLEDMRRAASWQDAAALLAEAVELRERMPLMSMQEKAALVDRLELNALRRVNDEGMQVIDIECRIGAVSLLIETKPPKKSSAHTNT